MNMVTEQYWCSSNQNTSQVQLAHNHVSYTLSLTEDEYMNTLQDLGELCRRKIWIFSFMSQLFFSHRLDITLPQESVIQSPRPSGIDQNEQRQPDKTKHCQCPKEIIDNLD
eukprot:Blabericola_migrator_1__12241@NODE_762_length_6620_cov_12_758736_g544_i0_p5_GENE_NODE_762_length_6620_cov_12_758736_g544_i0NODE_762_length_6620_cov_12_758736_g544_i0_p5_ORF_typecomplete_len111_score5_78_NODE_762_length_6620_cov_12_758736_g544_i0333665